MTVKIANTSIQYYCLKCAEDPEMIEEDETNNLNGPIKYIDRIETLDLIEKYYTINSCGPLFFCINKYL